MPSYRELSLAAMAFTKAMDEMGFEHLYTGSFSSMILRGQGEGVKPEDREQLVCDSIRVVVENSVVTLKYRLMDHSKKFLMAVNDVTHERTLIYFLDEEERTGTVDRVKFRFFGGPPTNPGRGHFRNISHYSKQIIDSAQMGMGFEESVQLPFLLMGQDVGLEN